MGFSEAINTCLKQKYATFQGRAPRSEYWFFQLFLILVYAVIVALFFMLGGVDAMNTGQMNGGVMFVAILAAIFVLGVFIPIIAVTVRRLHDRNMSGWWYLAALVAGMIPFVGFIASIALLVITILKGTEGANKFGPDPLALHGDADVFR